MTTTINVDKHNIPRYIKRLEEFIEFIKQNESEIKKGSKLNNYQVEKQKMKTAANNMVSYLQGDENVERNELVKLASYTLEYSALLDETIAALKKQEYNNIKINLTRLNELHNLIHHISQEFIFHLKKDVIY